MADDRHGADFSPRPQLRIAALLAVLTLLFVPLQAYYLEPAALLKVAPFYVFAAALGGLLLVLTYTALGMRYAQQLSLLLRSDSPRRCCCTSTSSPTRRRRIRRSSRT